MAYALEDEVGDIIAKARMGGDLGVDDLAEAAEIGADDLRAMEAYERVPSEQETRRLATALNLEFAALWASATEAWEPAPVVPELAAGYRVAMLPYPPMRVTMYIVGDPSSRAALVIDPGAEPDRILGILRSEGWRAVAILITHSDADHVDALPAVYRDLRVPVWIPSAERVRAPHVDPADVREIEGAAAFAAGPFEIQTLPTPGHSVGHTGYAISDGVMVGDAIFAGSIGGSRLGAEMYPRQLAAVREQILSRPASSKLFPGHGPPTTVGEERAHNPFFAARADE